MSHELNTIPVLIAGAGMGGLSVALALAQYGYHSHILEKVESFTEAGAGIQLGPNATRVLRIWGLERKLRDSSSFPEGIIMGDGLTGQTMTTVPLGHYLENRHGAPYFVMHRADLQKALLDAVQADHRITISNDFSVMGFQVDQNSVTVHSEDGQQVIGSALIGADGIWSSVRTRLFNIRPKFIGKSAWRTVVPSDFAPDFFCQPYTSLWMAPDSHLVYYPVLSGQAINIIAVIDDKDGTRGWNTPGNKVELLKHFGKWHELPREFVKGLSGWNKWSLFNLPRLKKWGVHNVTLLGDAVHPPAPFLAQGAAMAIEDAAVLASEVALTQGNFSAAFRRYEKARRARVEKVVRLSKRMGNIYHMPTPVRQLRNQVLKYSSRKGLINRYDWLYGFDATR